MNDLIRAMAEDLSIDSFRGEAPSDYLYRLCFSALAAHILFLASGNDKSNYGISKKSQTETIQRLVNLYQKYIGIEKSRFIREHED